MPVVVIGGHTRSVGKTSVVAGLIAALRDLRWTALKITQYGHGVCSANGRPCDCATGDHSWAVTEEKNRSGESDTSRFLVAGAEHSWWVRTEQGRLAEAMPRIRAILAAAENTIIESNSVLRFLKPDLYLTVLDPATADFKSSAQQFLDRADAVLLHAERIGSRLSALGSREDDPKAEGASLGKPSHTSPGAESREPGADSRFSPHYKSSQASPVWKQVSLKPVLTRPTFAIHPPEYVTPEIVAFVRSRLSST